MPFVVLPDRALPPRLAAALATHVGDVLLRHPSGEAWVVGTTDGRRLVTARTRDVEVALVGDDALDERALAARLVGVTSADRLAADDLTDGDVLLLARSADRLRCRPPLFLTRSLCWTDVDGVPVVSDDQLVLQRLAGLRPDPAVLASRLTDAEITLPVGLASIWAGVRTLRPGEQWDAVGTQPPRAVRWWQPPRPDRALDELAPALHDAVAAALATRTARHDERHDEVSADLSGGLDSTTLSFFLARTRPRLHTLFLASDNVANADHLWARRAADELGAHHLVVPYASVLPRLVDAGTGTLAATPEGPSIASVSAAAVPLLEEVLAPTGSRLHLNGHAGDALFGPVTTIPWSLLRARGAGRLARLRRMRLANRYPLGATLRMLAERGTYEDDLRRVARGEAPPRAKLVEHSRWVATPRLHPALTPAARDLVAGLAAQELAGGHGPWSPDRTVHQVVQYLAVHGADVRRVNQAATRGLRFDSPYLDRRVVDAALALRVTDRAHQQPAKPLLAAARPAGMSLEYFTRADKGDYSAEVFAQHRAAAPLLRALFSSGSVLEELGLVDPDRVLRAVDAYSVDGAEYRDLDQIAFTERWLRSLDDPAPAAAAVGTRPANEKVS